MRRVWLAALLLLWAHPVAAQETLPPVTPVSGTAAAGGDQQWAFLAYSGAVMSFLAEGEGQFDPLIVLSDGSGRELTGSDDYDYPDSRDALLEAVTLNRTDTYTLSVAGFGGAEGSYRLTMLPGFARLHSQEAFDEDAGWRASEPGLTAAVEDGALSLTLTGRGITAFAAEQNGDSLRDFYLQARVASVRGGNGWIVGAALRQRGSNRYRVEFNDQGRWRFMLDFNGDSQTLRDWTPHPNIVAEQTEFTFAVMARGAGFDVFYNGGFVGSVTDTTLSEGQFGLEIGTAPVPDSRTTAQFDDLLITVPLREDGAPIIPQRVIVSDATNMSQALRRNHVVQATGTLALTVPEVLVEYARAGVNRQMVGQETTYTNFALGAAVTMQSASAGTAGCGLVLRHAGDENYTLAYIDATGGYGVSRRRPQDFAPGLFGQRAEFAADPITRSARHHLLVIADQNTLYYYVNGVLVGSADNAPQAGEVGTAVVNFDGVITTCRFSDLWLWRW